METLEQQVSILYDEKGFIYRAGDISFFKQNEISTVIKEGGKLESMPVTEYIERNSLGELKMIYDRPDYQERYHPKKVKP